jgi:EAL domain-containing protein (putative c-di-GMP-specific phosphodiesterase class I)
MNVVAEGIESMEQVEALSKMDCDFIQGYVYSKPISVDEFEVWRERYEE